MSTDSATTKSNKAQTIAFRVTPDQYADLIRFATADGHKNVSAYMRALVAEEITERASDAL